jgi:hypothetical protein
VCGRLFVMIEMLIFQNFVTLIPASVFCGVLIKVGYDVFDFEPFIVFVKRSIESHVDKGRTTDVLKKKYLSALCGAANAPLHESCPDCGFGLVAI